MKKQFLLIGALMACTQLMAAWTPNETYAGWIRKIYMDQAWVFGDAGSRYNHESDPDNNVKTANVPGLMCFNMMTWNDRSANYDDHDMNWADVILRSNSGEEHLICRIYFTGENSDHSSACEFGEGIPYYIYNYNGNKTYYVQRRFHRKYESGSTFCYFVTEYSASLRQFVETYKSSLSIKINCIWDDNDYNYYSKQTFVSLSFMSSLNNPSLNILEWEDKNNATQLKYNCSTNNGDAKTSLIMGNNSKTTTLYNQNLSQSNAYKKLSEFSTVNADLTGNATLYLQAKNSRVYSVNHSYWENHSLCNGAPSSMTQYSGTVSAAAPQMKHPYNLEVHDNGTGSAQITWNIQASTASVVDASNFVVEYFADKDYKNLISTTNVNFDKSKTYYSVDIPFSERDQHVIKAYYRVHRAHANANELGVKAEGQLQTDFVKPLSLLATNNGNNVMLSWELSPNGLWTSNTRVEIRQGNTTIGTFDKKTTSTTVTGLATCVPYEFSIAITDNGVVKNNYKITHSLPSSAKGLISNLSVSKGFYNDHTTLSWTIDKANSNFSFFNINRCPLSEVGKDDARWVTLSSVNHTQGMLSYTYQDNTATPGEYYMYRVEGYSQCDTETNMMDHKDGIGFSQPYGIVAGQITFNGNQGLPNARVVAQGEDVRQGRSLHFTTTNSGQQPKYAILDASNANQIMAKEGTVEMWLRLEDYTTNQTILSRTGMIDWSVTTNKELIFDCKLISGANLTYALQGSGLWVDNQFNHVAISYKTAGSKLTLQLMINGRIAITKQVATSAAVYSTSTEPLYLGSNGATNMVGYMDEIRFWNTFRDSAAIADHMDCYLSGSEKGLTAYYRCDDDNTGELYDLSKTSSTFNERHMKVTGAYTDPNIVPTTTQLALSTRTDQNGNYVLNAIPYNASGSLYTLTPMLGVHQFSPINQPLFFSTDANTHNRVNFTDESGFTVSGRILYENTNYPVSDCDIYIDGAQAIANNQPIKTDQYGQYTITVPIGKHYIELKKDGHTMMSNGRFPANENELYDFQENIVDVDFVDQTYVTLVGRVVGGHREAEKVHGMQQCVNNIGTATIELSAGDAYILNKGTATRTWATPDGCEVKSQSTTGASDAAKSTIKVLTDPVTGEFAMRVPPMDLQVKRIFISSNPAYVFDVGNYEVIDLGSGLMSDTIVDSLQIGDKMRYFSYMRALDAVHYEDPVMSFEQTNTPEGVYGDERLIQQTYDGKLDTIPFYAIINDTVKYTYGYPMYQQSHVYKHQVEVYEPYYNYDQDPDNPVLDKMPYANVVVTVNNQLGKKEMAIHDTTIVDTITGEVREIQRGEVLNLADNQIMLDSMGRGQYNFQAGDPNIMADQDYAFAMDVSYVSPDGTRTYKWNRKNKFQGIILGGLTSGTNFVTAGPDQLTYILRDPAGSMSYATWTTQSSVSSNLTSSLTISSSSALDTYVSIGPDVELTVGLGVMETVTIDAVLDVDIYKSSTTETQTNVSKVITTTAMKEISTGTSNYHVLTPGDVFIGYSTNTLFGNAQTVCLEKVKGVYQLTLKDKVTVGDAFKTDFNFSQFYIENTLMPNYIKMRNALDWNIVDAATYAQLDSSYNTSKQMKYFTTLKREDPKFGTKDTYKAIYPKDWQELGISGMIDEVNFYNSEYHKWQQILAANEQAKIKVKEKEEYLLHNISFDGGSSRTETYSTDSLLTIEYGALDQEIKTTDFGIGVLFCGAGEVNHIITTKSTVLRSNESITHHSSSTVKYHLEGNTLEALTMDVYQAPDGFGPIFINRGGQTYCPYEDEEKTRYYEPGKHTIHTATVNMQDPKLTVDQPVVTDVPIDREATFQIAMANRADVGTNNFAWMRFYSIAGSNPHGAKIYVEGKAIAGDGTGDGLLYRFYPGETLHANVSVKQTDISIVDYDSLAFALTPDCEPYTHADTIYLSAHFVPKCSGVSLAVDNRVVNTKTDTTLKAVIYDYDRNYRYLKRILLQYRSTGDNNWNLIHEWVTDSTKVSPGIDLLDDNFVTYQWDLRNTTIFHDGIYELRAVSQCNYGNEMIECESDYSIVTKDVSRPQPLGQPSPVNGIWTADNELYVTYNDKIQPDMILPDYVQVKAKKNRHALTNDIALATNGNDLGAYTEASVDISGRGFSWEAWINYSEPGTIWQHGNEEGLSLSIDAQGHLVISTAKAQLTSTETLPQNQWSYLMFTLNEQNDSTAIVNAYIAYDITNRTLLKSLPLPMYSRIAPMLIGRQGKVRMHDMIIWSKARSEAVMLSERNLSKELYTDGVIGYWPMNEGRGTTASDVLRHRDLKLTTANWWISGTNYAKHITPLQPETISVASNLRAEDNNYALEFWIRMEQEGEIMRTPDSSFVLAYHNREISISTPMGTVSTECQIDWADAQWHHFTLMGNKYGQSVLITDGQRRESPLIALLPDLTRKPIIFGKGNEIDLDEVRIWSGDVSESWLKEHRYNQLGDNALNDYPGLAYYEHYNQLPALQRAETTPALMPVGKYESVAHTYTASTDKVVISITESPANIEGCTLEFTVENLLDQNGNYSVPATWTAYVNRNQLVWGESEMNITMANMENDEHLIDIINNSGHSESWTIEDAPEWLQLSTTAGTIAPLTTQHLTFTISPSLAIGTYDKVMYLVGNQGMRQPLYLHVTVTGEQPNWEINPYDYTSSMNLIAVATINGVTVDDKNDKIAAFIGDKLAGVASPQYNSIYYKYYIMMDIYANNTGDQQPITFKIWDASTGIVYTQLTASLHGQSQTINFAANTLVGTVTSPLLLATTDKAEQTIQMEKGWNWISFNVTDNEGDLNDFMQHFVKDATIIKSQSAYAQVDTVRGKFVGSLRQIDITRSYHINTLREANDVVAGNLVNTSTTGITLGANRWTWISYLPQLSQDLNTALSNLTPTIGDIIKGRKGFATWDGYQWIGSLSAMVPGQGYMYYNASTATQTLYYPAITTHSPVASRLSPLASSPSRLLAFTPVDPGTYQNNMTITAQVMDGSQVITDAEVGVFAGTECRASETAYEGLYFLTVPGDQTTELSFQVAIGGEMITPEQSLIYQTDAMIGDLYKPYIIQIGEPTNLESPSPSGEGRGEVHKILENEQVYIIRDGKKTSILGLKVDK